MNDVGEPDANTQELHRALLDVAGRVLHVSETRFEKHTDLAWELIDHDIARQFDFDPPLRPNYYKDYLFNALRISRSKWRRHWVKTKGGKHPRCPDLRFPSLVELWKTKKNKEDSKKMQRARLKNKTRPMHNPTSLEGYSGKGESALGSGDDNRSNDGGQKQVINMKISRMMACNSLVA